MDASLMGRLKELEAKNKGNVNRPSMAIGGIMPKQILSMGMPMAA
jgi:hypothetical protein